MKKELKEVDYRTYLKAIVADLDLARAESQEVAEVVEKILKDLGYDVADLTSGEYEELLEKIGTDAPNFWKITLPLEEKSNEGQDEITRPIRIYKED